MSEKRKSGCFDTNGVEVVEGKHGKYKTNTLNTTDNITIVYHEGCFWIMEMYRNWEIPFSEISMDMSNKISGLTMQPEDK